MRDLDRLELVKRNTEEIVTEEELIEILEKPNPTAYVGYEPSGKIHMGHVLTVNKLLDLQQAGFEVIVLLADVHAYLNEKGTMEQVKEVAEYNKRCFIALGLEEDKTRFVLGSSYQLNEDYVLNVLKLARETTLLRARRSMDEVSRSAENPMVSQMIYPLMQSMDIAALGIDLAVGGIDQRKIHMLAREGLPKLGFKAPTSLHTPILPGLDGKKMSSSKGNYISVDDSAKEVEEKLRAAYCPAGQIEDNPVIFLFRYHIFPRYPEITIKRPEKFGGDIIYSSYIELESAYRAENLHPLDLKKAAAEYMNRILEPVRVVLEHRTG